MKKSTITIVIGVSVVFLLVSFLLVYHFGSLKHIEDTNGDQTKLTSIKLADKVTMRDRGVEVLSSLKQSGAKSGVTNWYANVDYDTTKISTRKFSGIKTVQATYVKEDDTLQIVIDNKLKSGNLEIVIVDPNNQIIKEIPVNTIEVVEIDETVEGVYRVLIGGESANFIITCERMIFSSQ